jgi:molybdopterin/thiamine biosynthesis adenylyltransferase/rhodanese-related sulfurtransferase
LDAAARRRYARHLLLPEVGEPGQARLMAARALVIGAGGLGSVTATYLAAAGVGVIGIIDDDLVEESNLQRQVIHDTAAIGMPKVASAARRLQAINPSVQVTQHPVRLTAANALEIIGGYDLVVDGADNFTTRYVVADACALLSRPHVWGSILRFDGQVSVWAPPAGPCYRCVFPQAPPAGSVASCAEAGVLGSLCAAIGAVQSTEAIKLITGVGRPLIGRLLIHDALDATWGEVPVRRNPACRLCGPHAVITEPEASAEVCRVPGPRHTASELAVVLEQDPSVVLVDVREPAEWAAGVLPGAILLPLAQVSELPVARDARIVLYCAAGARSAAGAERLRAAGFTDVADLDGGIRAWTGPLSAPAEGMGSAPPGRA